MIYAQPSATGTRPDRFIKVRRDLMDAASLLRLACKTLQDEIMATRNYGHIPFPEGANAHDFLQVEHLRNHLPSIDKMASDLLRAAERAQGLDQT